MTKKDIGFKPIRCHVLSVRAARILNWDGVMMSETTIAALKSELRGDVIEPGDARYDAARKVCGG